MLGRLHPGASKPISTSISAFYIRLLPISGGSLVRASLQKPIGTIPCLPLRSCRPLELALPLLQRRLLATAAAAYNYNYSSQNMAPSGDQTTDRDAVAGSGATTPRSSFLDLPVNDTFTQVLPGDEVGNKYDHDQ